MAPQLARIVKLLGENGLTLGTVESATGGLISDTVTDLAGSSDFFRGGVTAYANEIKTGVIGVAAETIYTHGAVSPQVVEEMASGGRKLLGVDICITDTGIAGPGGGTESKPVGLFYFGLATPQGVFSRRYQFHGDRAANKKQAAAAALDWLVEYLSQKV